MIEGQLDEAREGDASPGRLDLTTDDRDKIRVANVSIRTGIESAGWGSAGHGGDCRGREADEN
jgi:hypothetical protein